MHKLSISYTVTLLEGADTGDPSNLRHSGVLTQHENGSGTDEDTVSLVSSQLQEAVRALRQIEQGQRVLHHLRGDLEADPYRAAFTDSDYRPKEKP
jgi:hypothetical protein